MTVQVLNLPAYTATRDGLVGALSLAEAAFTDAEFSYDPNSDYRKALAVINAVLLQLRSLAVSTLKKIDDGIAKGDLVDALNKSAAEAESEATRLARVARDIDKISKVVGKLTAVVVGIAGLPFL